MKAMSASPLLRTATRVRTRKDQPSETRTFKAWLDSPTLVLLGEPGAGKSFLFEQACVADPEGSLHVRAVQFASARTPWPEWFGKTLFIDGLDEVRIDGATATTVATIADMLRLLGRPSVRLSCRASEWWQSIHAKDLSQAFGGSEVVVVRLDALTTDQQLELLRAQADPPENPERVLRQAASRGIDSLLGQPLMIKLISRVATPNLPHSRAELYERACYQLATEPNPRQLSVRRVPQPEALMVDAGLLCSLMLLADLDGFTLDPTDTPARWLASHEIPLDLAVPDPRPALQSSLFVGDAGSLTPLHRSVAEYLAARSIAQRIHHANRPLHWLRVEALISQGGAIIESLRGLNAWLAVHCRGDARRAWIDLDPVGVVQFGDVHALDRDARRHLLRRLHLQLQREPQLRGASDASDRWADLIGDDIADALFECLEHPARDYSREGVRLYLLAGLRQAPRALPGAQQRVADIFKEPSHFNSVRVQALETWFGMSADPAIRRQVVDELWTGKIDDAEDELLGTALSELLASAELSPVECLQYFRPPKADSLFGAYRHLWSYKLVQRSSPTDLGELADRLGTARPEDPDRLDFDTRSMFGRVLRAALDTAGSTVSIERLAAWLEIGSDTMGTSWLAVEDREYVRTWLAAHPERVKELLSQSFRTAPDDADAARRHLWRYKSLYHTPRPPEWAEWLLQQAALSTNDEVRAQCVAEAARDAVDRPPGSTISIEAVEAWLAVHRKWSAATSALHYDEWLESIWWYPLDHWRAKEHMRTLESAQADRTRQDARRQALMSDLAGLPHPPRPQALHDITLAYLGRFSDIRGETPVERVQQFLGGSLAEAESAIAAIGAALERSDLPTASEILSQHREQRYPWLRPCALLAADLAWQGEPTAVDHWRAGTIESLVAFQLTDRRREDEACPWFDHLLTHHQSIVVPILASCLQSHLRLMPQDGGLDLRVIATHPEVAQQVLPAVLATVPARATEPQVRMVARHLLPVAARSMASADWAELVRERLHRKVMDAAQRVTWHVASLTVDGAPAVDALLAHVGTSQTRAGQLATAMHWMFASCGLQTMPAAGTARLIECLAPFNAPADSESGWVGDGRGRDLVRRLIDQLAELADHTGLSELRRLHAHEALRPWRWLLDQAIHQCVERARAAALFAPSPVAVARTLAQLAPANSQDLCALVVEKLGALQAKIRGTESDTLDLFYRDDGVTPKAEPDCRNVLHGLMQPLLNGFNVELITEATAADEKRADLRASTVADQRLLRVPIEVKKDDYAKDGAGRTLWNAWRIQLQALYSNDPATGGHGIYLVLWFGGKRLVHGSGALVRDASHLQALLQQDIGEDDGQFLKAIVLDLSPRTLNSPPARS